MEEEKNTLDEQVDKTPLSKEEILERSRKENAKHGDEREQKLLKRGSEISYMIGLGLLCFVYIVNLIVLRVNSSELVAIVIAVAGIDTIWQGKFGTKKKKTAIIWGIIALVVSTFLLALWVLTLCGISWRPNGR